MIIDIVKVVMPAALAFFIGIGITPLVSHYLYKYKAWKKKAGKHALNGDVASEFNRLHNETEMRAPRMGGIIIWGSVVVTTLFFALAGMIAPTSFFAGLNFLSRSQTVAR